MKAGIVDLNSEFDPQETAALFMNSAHGIGSEFSHTGLGGPSIYPTPALGLTLLDKPAEGWSLRGGIFDGVAGDPNHPRRFAIKLSARDGALLIGQAERRFGDALRVEGGAYLYTARFDSLDDFTPVGAPRKHDGDGGIYGLIEGKIRPGGEGGEGGLNGWLRAGSANDDINRIADYFGGGLVYTGIVPGRPKDEAGLAIARAGFGSPAREAAEVTGSSLHRAETTLEATYRVAFRDWLTLQPDVQYVVHPDGLPNVRNALVIGVRLVLTTTR